MDPASLTISASAVYAVLQPYLPVIAAKAAEKLGEELPAYVGKTWAAIQKKFDGKATAKEALLDLLKNPEDPDLQGGFRAQLKKALDEDTAFAAELKKLLGEAAAGTSYQARVHGSGTVVQGSGNTVAGAGGVVIGGNVKGDVSTGGQLADDKKNSAK